jgi:hypothetical protein
VLYMFRVVSLALAVATWQYHVCDAAITQTISAGSLITVDVAVYDASSGGVSQCVLSPHARAACNTTFTPSLIQWSVGGAMPRTRCTVLAVNDATSRGASLA